jgi:hypothetical protein
MTIVDELESCIRNAAHKQASVRDVDQRVARPCEYERGLAQLR